MSRVLYYEIFSSALHIVKGQGVGVKLQTVEKCKDSIPEIDFAGFSGLDFPSFLVYTFCIPREGGFL